MDALSYPWEFYIPKAQKWSAIAPGKMAALEAAWVRLDAKLTAIKILESFTNLRGVSVGRATLKDLEYLSRFVALNCVCLVMPRINSLAPLGALAGIAALELDDPPFGRTRTAYEPQMRLGCATSGKSKILRRLARCPIFAQSPCRRSQAGTRRGAVSKSNR